MAKLHFVRKARKAIPSSGIEVGDSYYHYKRRVNGKGTPKVCSKTKPRRSAYATSSPFLGALMDLEDALNGLVAGNGPTEYIIGWLETVASEVEALGDDCMDKSQNVELGMKNGAGAMSAELLQARAEHCSALASALREAASELEASGFDGLSEVEEGSEEEPTTTSVADVVSNIVWLP